MHDAAGGSLDLATSYGKVEAGVRDGTPAWLDLEASSGRVRNLLTASDAPDGSEEPLRIRARTSYGDIVVRAPEALPPKSEPCPSARRSRSPGSASPTATTSCSTASTWPSPEGRVFALLGPNGAGKTTTVAHPVHADARPTAARSRVAGHDVVREPDAVRAAIGVTGQFSAVDNLLTGEENLRLMADLHHLGRQRGPAARGRPARAVRADRGRPHHRPRPTPAACAAGSTSR